MIKYEILGVQSRIEYILSYGMFKGSRNVIISAPSEKIILENVLDAK